MRRVDADAVLAADSAAALEDARAVGAVTPVAAIGVVGVVGATRICALVTGLRAVHVAVGSRAGIARADAGTPAADIHARAEQAVVACRSVGIVARARIRGLAAGLAAIAVAIGPRTRVTRTDAAPDGVARVRTGLGGRGTRRATGCSASTRPDSCPSSSGPDRLPPRATGHARAEQPEHERGSPTDVCRRKTMESRPHWEIAFHRCGGGIRSEDGVRINPPQAGP